MYYFYPWSTCYDTTMGKSLPHWGLQLSSMQKGHSGTVNTVRMGHRVPPKTKFCSNLQ